VKENIIIACSKNWFLKKFDKSFIKKNIILVKNKEKLNKKSLEKIKPSIIFFPHWSHKVDKYIVKNYNCICFHTAPLPYGRGGSPIQNLIKRNFSKSPICAFKMTNTLDAGPILLKKIVSLNGDLDQIMNRISKIIIGMMKTIISKKIIPKIQKGKVVMFKRIKPNESKIKNEKNIKKIYDKIRMLDSDEYPRAYIMVDKFKLLLSKAVLNKNFISCNAKIIKIKK
tara:strand:- start:1520 stop:2197 length:678 start_codon:yes stop_codon:yes gene_type:complete